MSENKNDSKKYQCALSGKRCTYLDIKNKDDCRDCPISKTDASLPTKIQYSSTHVTYEELVQMGIKPKNNLVTECPYCHNQTYYFDEEKKQDACFNENCRKYFEYL